MAAGFLARWPELQSLKKAPVQALRAFFYKHNSRGPQLMEERLEAVQKAKALTTDPAIIEPARALVYALAAMLKTLHQAIAVLVKQIELALDQEPDAAIVRRFTSSCRALALRLLVAFATN